MSNATAFTGSSAAMKKPSQWLSWEDLDGRGDVTAEIEGVFLHTNAVMKDGKVEPKVYTVKFKGKEKELVLNSTNRKTLALRFGADTTKWPSNKIILYVQDGIRAFGSVTKGIRIKFND